MNSNDSLFYSNQIDSLAFVDQKTRTGIYTKLLRVHFKYKLDSTLNKSDSIYQEALIYRVKSLKADSSNIYHLLDLIDQFGFPSETKVGNDSHENACILFVHFDYDTLNKTLQPILDSALKRNEISPWYYAWIIDRHRANFGAQPIYYANVYSCEMYKFLTEEKKKLVFENRKKIGLKPIVCD